MGETQLKIIPVSELAAKGLVPDETPLPPFALVVDDESIIADTLAAILRLEGYAALALYDAESALELPKRRRLI